MIVILAEEKLLSCFLPMQNSRLFPFNFTYVLRPRDFGARLLVAQTDDFMLCDLFILVSCGGRYFGTVDYAASPPLRDLLALQLWD